MIKILFADTAHPILEEKLNHADFICDYFGGNNIDEFKQVLPQYHGLIIRSKLKLDKDILSQATNLKCIGRVGAGLENIDVEFAKAQGIACFNAPEGNRDAVGEHAVGMLLALLNNMFRANSEVKNGKWVREGNRGIEIKGKTIGIIGYGNMGSAFAEKLSGFGAKVISYDKYKYGYGNNYTSEVDLETIFKESDILSLHVPLTEETKFMVNSDFISNFEKNIYIINTARGKVLKTSDLVKAMQNGKVKGAALDVLEYEKTSFEAITRTELPMEFEYLLNSSNVILSPHIAGWTQESNIKLAEAIANKIISHLT